VGEFEVAIDGEVWVAIREHPHQRAKVAFIRQADIAAEIPSTISLYRRS